MNRLALAAPIAILAAALAGCSSPGSEKSQTASIKPIEHPYRAGSGVVQAVTPAPQPIAAGSTPGAKEPTSATNTGVQRLRIRMDDGRMMWVDTSSRDFQPGTRVQLSDANEIRRQ